MNDSVFFTVVHMGQPLFHSNLSILPAQRCSEGISMVAPSGELNKHTLCDNIVFAIIILLWSLLCHLYKHFTVVVVAIVHWLQHGLLVSGGGTVDRTIRFWNMLTGQPLHHVDTGSQVCNLAWSRSGTELVSTHGYSQNQILLWRYPSMSQIAKLTGHTTRVLYLVTSH